MGHPIIAEALVDKRNERNRGAASGVRSMVEMQAMENNLAVPESWPNNTPNHKLK
jgi:hypothetical protein